VTAVGWVEFAASAPELAALGAERIERFRFVFVGTIRKDGGPRVNPVEAYFVDGELVLNMIWRSLKALDLIRDERVYVHTPILDRLGGPGEFKLRGRACEVGDPGFREAAADVIEAAIEWRPPERSHFFAVAAESAAFVTYGEGGKQHVVRWFAGR
jgi:hypothetical protein